ncbi:MAG: HPr family phosphocarrier protein, partial [Betaproteobacteria bacterium]|nr:HPr family phosphocarrier protein [Betaproteobacteria bacterium]
MTTLLLKSPLAGWCLPLADVPDAVFAERMAGDGIAIDPTGSVLHAPCDGEIVPMKEARHALTIRTAGGHEILLHVGIDTVALAGEGFEMLVRAGQTVAAGDPLLRFDLDLIARRARSTVTPVLLASEGVVLRRVENRGVVAGDFLMEVDLANGGGKPVDTHGEKISRHFLIAFDHGLHARPAAQVAAALRPFDAKVTFVKNDRCANARSTVALMSLGVKGGDVIEALATGTEAEKALVALAALLGAPVSDGAVPKPIEQVAIKSAARSDLARIRAVIASSGVAIGAAVQLLQPEIAVEENGSGVDKESAALQSAISVVKAHLDNLISTAGAEQQTILAAHVELIQDPELASRADDLLQRGKSAGFAWRRALRSIVETLQRDGDEHMMERVADLRDLENQVLMVLDGQAPGNTLDLPERAILIADELLPSQLVSLDASRIAGICTARGGPTSHVAIIAAAMGVPALVAAGRDVLD